MQGFLGRVKTYESKVWEDPKFAIDSTNIFDLFCARHWLGLLQVNILFLFIWLLVEICLDSVSLELETEKGFGCTWRTEGMLLGRGRGWGDSPKE